MLVPTLEQIDLRQHVPAEIEPAEWNPISPIPNVYILPKGNEPSYSVAFTGDKLLVIHFNRPPGRPEKIDAAIATPMTPAIQNWLMPQLPDWWDWDFAARALIPEQQAVMGDGRQGRFLITVLHDKPWALKTERHALNSIRNRHHPQSMQFTPDANLVFAHYSFTLWSDGVALRSSLHPMYADEKQGINLTPEAKELLAVALRRAYWRADDRWRPLMMVSSVQRQTLAEDKVGGYRSFAEKSLRQLVTDSGLTLYLVTEMSGHLGEDGDGDEYRLLFDNPQEAQQYYQEIKL